LIVDTIG
jgi:hypothetical protein